MDTEDAESGSSESELHRTYTSDTMAIQQSWALVMNGTVVDPVWFEVSSTITMQEPAALLHSRGWGRCLQPTMLFDYVKQHACEQGRIVTVVA
jgi:hypothetical protein